MGWWREGSRRVCSRMSLFSLFFLFSSRLRGLFGSEVGESGFPARCCRWRACWIREKAWWLGKDAQTARQTSRMRDVDRHRHRHTDMITRLYIERKRGLDVSFVGLMLVDLLHLHNAAVDARFRDAQRWLILFRDEKRLITRYGRIGQV